MLLKSSKLEFKSESKYVQVKSESDLINFEATPRLLLNYDMCQKKFFLQFVFK